MVQIEIDLFWLATVGIQFEKLFCGVKLAIHKCNTLIWQLCVKKYK